MRHAARAMLFLCCLLLAAGSQAQNIVTLRVAAQTGTEPKFIDGGNGRVIGLCIDIFRTIERIDPGLVFAGDQQWLPLIRAVSEVTTRQDDLACAIQRSPERERQLVFLDPVIIQFQYLLVARADDQLVVNSWDDLRALGERGVVLVNRGFTTSDYLKQLGGLQINASATDPAINLQMLVARRGRVFLHRNPGLETLIARTGMTGKVKVLPHVMYENPTYVALGKHVDAAVVARVRRAVEQMERTGELARIVKKWE